MGEPSLKLPVQIFCAFTYQDESILEKVLLLFQNCFGDEEMKVKYEFSTFTNYYCKEMGAQLYKSIISFRKLCSPENIHHLKIWSNLQEKEWSHFKDGKPVRSINCDIGYLTLSKVILFSTKNYYHRIYLGEGIYAEITLSYRKPSFSALKWTYPDYRQEKVIGFFNILRKLYKSKLKSNNGLNDVVSC